jgi:uncharacterized protein (TIGR02246 family)
MATTTGRPVADELEIRRLIEDWAEAIRVGDVDGSLANYAPNVVAFDLLNPLQYRGYDTVRTRLEEWLASFHGPVDYENRDLTIAIGDDIAFSHSINHVTATTTEGQQLDMYWRATVCFRKVGGEWIVTHTHNSVPFNMETREASLDLKP